MSTRTFLLLLAVAGGMAQNRERLMHWLHPTAPRAPGTEQVVLYSTTWCGYCAKTRLFFQQHGISYEDRDVETSSLGRNGYESLGGGGVPIVVVNDSSVIRGYQPDTLKRLLAP